MERRLCFCFVLVLAACFLPIGARGQNILGTILGTVMDTSGAIVPGAKVTVIHVATGLVRTQKTNSAGEYSFPQLPVGQYAIEVEQAGFKKSQHTGIELRVDDRLRVDVVLQLGQLSETIAVEARAPVVSTDSSTVGNVVGHRTITELPLNGRDFNQLSVLVPGVNPGSVKGTPANAAQSSAISVNGNRPQSNNYLIDGADNNDLVVNFYVQGISTEAIQEFKVLTSTYSAEFGRSPGGQVNVATKSGTNQFHGVAYEYLRNAALDAKNFFAPPGSIAGFKRNQFGAAGGGPIKTNKTFFFGNYEGTRIRQTLPLLATVPTPAMKSGNFSALLGPQIGTDAAGRPILRNQIFDPLSLHAVNGVQVREPFPNNTIPQARISQIGANILKLFPDPNSGATANSGIFSSAPSTANDSNQYTVRLDHRFSDSHSLFGRYTHTGNVQAANCPNSPIPGGGTGLPCPVDNRFHHGTLNYTWLIGSNRINEARFSFNRLGNMLLPVPPDRRVDFTSQLGISGSSTVPIDLGLPALSFTGYSPLGHPFQYPQRRFDNTFDMSDSFSWTKGSHIMKFGVDFRRFQLNGLIDQFLRGTIAFNPYYSAAATTAANGVVNPVTNTGNSIADVLLGYPFTSLIGRVLGGQQTSWIEALRTSAINVFAQDDYRVRRDLTLNVGLRWEYNSPGIDKYNHLSTFDPAVPGNLRLATPQRQNVYGAEKSQFAPRIGFAYTPFGPKTVFRAGYGIFWDVQVLNTTHAVNATVPFLTQLNFQQSTNGLPNIALASPWSGSGVSPLPSAFYIADPYRNGYVQQWNVNIQRELSSTLGLTIGYVGAKGTHLQMTYDFNAPKPNPAFTQSLRPYPQFSSITRIFPSADSNYNSLQVGVEKKFSKGLAFTSAYTFGKSIDDSSVYTSSAIAVTDFRLERGLSAFDTRHRWVSSYIWEVPYGHGRTYGKAIPPALNLLLGGWQSNAIVTFQSGIPVDPIVGLQLSGTQTGTRPDATCNPNDFDHRVEKWFNTACFSNAFTGRYGTAGRNIIIGPGVANVDFAMFKKFSLGKEDRYVQFRAEAFNILNHPNLNNPTAVSTSASFGRITSASANARQIQFALRVTF